MEAKAYGRDRRVWTFAGRSRARPEQVYDVLADRIWNGQGTVSSGRSDSSSWMLRAAPPSRAHGSPAPGGSR